MQHSMRWLLASITFFCSVCACSNRRTSIFRTILSRQAATLATASVFSQSLLHPPVVQAAVSALTKAASPASFPQSASSVGHYRIPKRIQYSSISQDQLSARTARAMVLSCMDFRLVDDTAALMDQAGYNNNYDQFVLAGASLGFKSFDTWKQAFEDHLNLSMQIHDTKEIFCIDHLNCGAYKKLYPDMHSDGEEYALHKQNLVAFKDVMQRKYPQLQIHLLLLGINGEYDQFS